MGGLEYTPRFNKIDFSLGSVYAQKETKTEVLGVRYILYISNSQEKLQEAVMCEKSNK